MGIVFEPPRQPPRLKLPEDTILIWALNRDRPPSAELARLSPVTTS